MDGEGLPAHCYLTLRIGTELVKQGVGARNLTPYDLAGLLVRGLDGSGGERSRFEALVDAAYAALAAEVKREMPGQPGQPQRLLDQEAYHGRFMALFGEGLRGLLDDVAAAKGYPMLRSASS